MANNFTNQIAQPALRGQGVKITLNSLQALSLIPTLTVGDVAEVESSGAIGYVSFIDTYGNSFEVTPESPATKFNSTGVDRLSVNELITVGV